MVKVNINQLKQNLLDKLETSIKKHSKENRLITKHNFDEVMQNVINDVVDDDFLFLTSVLMYKEGTVFKYGREKKRT